MRIHTGAKPYKCETCEYKLIRIIYKRSLLWQLYSAPPPLFWSQCFSPLRFLLPKLWNIHTVTIWRSIFKNGARFFFWVHSNIRNLSLTPHIAFGLAYKPFLRVYYFFQYQNDIIIFIAQAHTFISLFPTSIYYSFFSSIQLIITLNKSYTLRSGVDKLSHHNTYNITIKLLKMSSFWAKNSVRLQR